MHNAAEMMRERQINVRVSEAEGVRMDAVAEHYGLNPQALLRFLVKREADTLKIAAAPLQKKPTKRSAK